MQNLQSFDTTDNKDMLISSECKTRDGKDNFALNQLGKYRCQWQHLQSLFRFAENNHFRSSFFSEKNLLR